MNIPTRPQGSNVRAEPSLTPSFQVQAYFNYIRGVQIQIPPFVVMTLKLNNTYFAHVSLLQIYGKRFAIGVIFETSPQHLYLTLSKLLTSFHYQSFNSMWQFNLLSGPFGVSGIIRFFPRKELLFGEVKNTSFNWISCRYRNLTFNWITWSNYPRSSVSIPL